MPLVVEHPAEDGGDVGLEPVEPSEYRGEVGYQSRDVGVDDVRELRVEPCRAPAEKWVVPARSAE